MLFGGVAVTPVARVRLTTAEATRFIDGWADAVGSDVDLETGYPRRVRRKVDGMRMVLIPAGTFQMGAAPRDAAAREYEARHAVTIPKAYYMDECEVTIDMWREFASKTSSSVPSETEGERGDLPVYDVSWVDARRYAQWANASLPTSSQWERAAKGGHDDYVYPWGATDDAKMRNGSDTNDGFAWIAPVKSFPPNDFGLFDMSGNVSEWCADRPEFAQMEGPELDGPDTPRVLRGGDYITIGHQPYRACAWDYARAEFHLMTIGFRCARTLP